MDYHVFLLSRIRERWLATGDTVASVAFGVGTTARLDHRRRADHGRGLRRVRQRSARDVPADGIRAGRRGSDRRDARPLRDRAGRDGAARPLELVDAGPPAARRRAGAGGRMRRSLWPITLAPARLALVPAALAAGIGAAALMAAAPDEPPGGAEIAVSLLDRLVVRRQRHRRVGAAARERHRQGDGRDRLRLVRPRAGRGRRTALPWTLGPAVRADVPARGWASCSCRFPTAACTALPSAGSWRSRC